jgi:hypothetical protein
MHNLGFALDGAWRVLLAGLLLGAGLPILFAVGIRTLSWTATTSSGVSAPSPLGRTLAYTLFAVVILGVALGITFIVASGFGKALSFDHLYPTIVDKH